MGRHTDNVTGSGPGPHPEPSAHDQARHPLPRSGTVLGRLRYPALSRRFHRPLRAHPLPTLVAAPVLLGTMALAVFRPGIVPEDIPWPFRTECPRTTVDVVAAPAIRAAVQEILQPLQGHRLGNDTCLHLVVRAQEPPQTLAGTRILPRDRWPHLWIPDSSVWLHEASDTLSPRPLGTLASSPLLVAGGAETLTDLDWFTSPPTWSQALDGRRPIAVSDLTTNAAGLLALSALQRSSPEKESRRAVASAVMAAGRGHHDTATEALAAIVEDDVRTTSALVPTTEQQVLATNRGSTVRAVAGVLPRDAGGTLDYPVVAVGPAPEAGALRDAVRLVSRELTGHRAAQVVRTHGFRDANGTAPQGSTTADQNPPQLPMPTPEELADLREQLRTLARPTRMLVLVDISTSMGARVRSGQDRISLVSDAVRSTVALLGDRDSVGIWTFASRLDGSQDWTEQAEVQALDTPDDDQTHRDRLTALAEELPDELRPGGSAIHDTVLAAARMMSEGFDPRSVNVIVLLTDGTNQDRTGIPLADLKDRVSDLTGQDTPVQMIAVGIGHDADMTTLRGISGATPGGLADQVADAQDVQRILLSALGTTD